MGKFKRHKHSAKKRRDDAHRPLASDSQNRPSSPDNDDQSRSTTTLPQRQQKTDNTATRPNHILNIVLLACAFLIIFTACLLLGIIPLGSHATSSPSDNPPPDLTPSASVTASPTPSSTPSVANDTSSAPAPTTTPSYTQVTPLYHPETSSEMLAYLRSSTDEHEYLPFRAEGFAWWTEGDEQVVEYLRPDRQYTAHFFIFALSDQRNAMTSTQLYLRFSEASITGGFYAFPGDVFPIDSLCACMTYDGSVGTEFCLPTASATTEALALAIDPASLRLRQAYGDKSWTISTDQAEAIINGGSIAIGTSDLSGYFAISREQALEFTFTVRTSAHGIASPVAFIRDDGKVALYDYLSADGSYRWSFPSYDDSIYSKVKKSGVYPLV